MARGLPSIHQRETLMGAIIELVVGVVAVAASIVHSQSRCFPAMISIQAARSVDPHGVVVGYCAFGRNSHRSDTRVVISHHRKEWPNPDALGWDAQTGDA